MDNFNTNKMFANVMPFLAAIVVMFMPFNAGSEYFLGQKGTTVCSAGSVIISAKNCRSACKLLDISFKETDLQSGQLCYKDARGNCYQNGLNGKGASLICREDSDYDEYSGQNFYDYLDKFPYLTQHKK